MPSADDNAPRFGWGLSAKADAWHAAEAAVEQAADRLGEHTADVAFIVSCGAHSGHTGGIGDVLARRINTRHVIGCSAAGCLAGAHEVEDASAVCVLLGRLPGVTMTPFRDAAWPSTGDGEPPRDERAAIDSAWRDALGMDAVPGAHRGTLLLADPFSVPITQALARIADASVSGGSGPVFGGLASRGAEPGQNALLLDGSVVHEGAVGLSFAGDVRIDTVVSQGCTPIGPTMVVTKSRGNLVIELGGTRAVDAAREVVRELDDGTKAKLDGGLLLGRAASEYRDRFGRGDFLIRSVVGADEAHGFLAVGDVVPAGRTVQFHVRDRSTAAEDLQLLLDGQTLHGPPAGVLAFTCTGRGRRLFGQIGHDARAVQRAFSPADAGSELAKPGSASGDAEPPVPLAGLFAAGEIGPIGGRPFLHGHTASLALFRSAETIDDASGPENPNSHS
ncbi:MAG: FIST N-terminal domain-containing protein [Planctomycetota bacterium]